MRVKIVQMYIHSMSVYTLYQCIYITSSIRDYPCGNHFTSGLSINFSIQPYSLIITPPIIIKEWHRYSILLYESSQGV